MEIEKRSTERESRAPTVCLRTQNKNQASLNVNTRHTKLPSLHRQTHTPQEKVQRGGHVAPVDRS